MIDKVKWEVRYSRKGESVESSLIVETEDISRTLERFSYDRDICLLYTSPSPRDRTRSRMPSSA